MKKVIALFFVVLLGAWGFVRFILPLRGDSIPANIKFAPSHRLLFKEGQDLHDLAKILGGDSAVLYEIVGVPARAPTTRKDLTDEFSFLKEVPTKISYEGYLFPDTYDIADGASAESIVRTMLKNFDRRVTPEMRAQVVAQGRTLHEVITMASILEKEVRGFEDRRKVADLLWRRLELGMGLQVDASVNYATGADGVFTTKKDRAAVSLWNTYKFKGLPVGPIGNPGLNSIKAALDPLPNNNWFYLTSPDGTVHYARTLEEHVANKKFLK